MVAFRIAYTLSLAMLGNLASGGMCGYFRYLLKCQRIFIKVSETKTQVSFRFGIQSRPRVLDQSVVKTQDYFFSFFPIDKK